MTAILEGITLPLISSIAEVLPGLIIKKKARDKATMISSAMPVLLSTVSRSLFWLSQNAFNLMNYIQP